MYFLNPNQELLTLYFSLLDHLAWLETHIWFQPPHPRTSHPLLPEFTPQSITIFAFIVVIYYTWSRALRSSEWNTRWSINEARMTAQSIGNIHRPLVVRARTSCRRGSRLTCCIVGKFSPGYVPETRLIRVSRRLCETDARQRERRQKRRRGASLKRARAAIRRNYETFKRLSDMDFFFFFLKIRVINFIGHLVRVRWRVKKREMFSDRLALMSRTVIARLLFDIWEPPPFNSSGTLIHRKMKPTLTRLFIIVQ